ncbi:coiled-coil domain-containing protein 39-like [Solea solea]|uniref:coiled-coil domain-containing protein 39-like n=1 Tax=Solea solea TaxID=90069 RepID=UPI00272C751D|nr:coiled-coil domain-containing protein 39-like [Solea solea]
MSSILDSVLANIGWDESFAIPEPNAENKALLDEIRMKEAKFAQLKNKLESNKDQKQFIGEFLQNGKQELDNIEALCKFKERESEFLQHLTSLAENETGRMTQDSAKMEKELQFFADRRNVLENSISKTKQKLQEFKEQMNWDQQAMDAFLKESALNDEETMAIIKYSQQDEQKIKALSLAIEKKNLEANEKRKAHDKEYAETLSAQLALDKAAVILWQAHQETQHLLKRWENTVMQMQRRDAEMQQCARQIEQAKQKIRNLNTAILVRKHFLETQRKTNKDTEKKIALAQQLVLKVRQELESVEDNCSAVQHELDCWKGTLNKAKNNVKTAMSNISKMQENIQDNNNKINEAKAHNSALEEKLQAVTQSSLSEEEKADQMEQFLRDEEQEIKELNDKLRSYIEQLSICKEFLQSLKDNEKDCIANVSKSRYIISCLKSELRKLQHDQLRHQMTVNELESSIVYLRKKLARLHGDVRLEEKQEIAIKIDELNKMVEEKKKTAHMLSIALKQSEDDIHFLRKELEIAKPQKVHLSEKVEELMLIDNKSDMEVKKLQIKKQESMVEHNIIKLKVKRIRNQLYNKADAVLSLEKRKLELQRDIKEREEELRIYREMQIQRLKIIEQERQRLRAELNEKLSKIDVTKKRCEILSFSIDAPEGEEDKWHAYHLVKVTQVKQELRQKGDHLDATVCKLELENKALGNTITLFSDSNSVFRKSLNKVKESFPEYQEKMNLAEQLRGSEETLKSKKREIQRLQQDIKNMNNVLESLLQEELLEKEKIKERELVIVKLNKELFSLQEKTDRAKRQCIRLMKQIRAANNTNTETFEEKDIKLRELKELNKSSNKMLNDALEDKPDLRSVVETYFQEGSVPD